MNVSPDEKVASQIVADISKEKLLPARNITLLKKKLASDGLDESDWVRLSDLSSNEES